MLRSVALRSFIVVGQTATASGDFSLEDLPSSSGRLDVQLRCLRAAFLYSHGLRRAVRVYLVLRGGQQAPRVLRVDGETVRFLRPDERSLATLVKKTLALAPERGVPGFVELKPGLALAGGDLDCVIADLAGAVPYLLEEGAPDLRTAVPIEGDAAFFLGDHLGLCEATRAELARIGARPISVGPVSLHSDDVITVVSNELDRAAGANGVAGRVQHGHGIPHARRLLRRRLRT